LEACATAIAANPASSTANLTAGNIHLDWAEWLLDRGKDPRVHLESAEAFLSRALELNPTDAFANFGRGIAGHLEALWSWAGGRDPLPELRRAEASFTRSAAIDPSYHAAPRHRGIVRLEQALLGEVKREEGRRLLAAAEADLRSAAALNPKDPQAQAGLARVLLAAGGSPSGEAKAAAERGAALDPLDPETVVRLAEVRAAGGDRDGAAKVLREALRRHPGSIKLLLALGEALADDPRTRDEAVQALRSVLNAFPSHPRALSLQASLRASN
jgi:tetratricopeptide (TPR) repeat protein